MKLLLKKSDQIYKGTFDIDEQGKIINLSLPTSEQLIFNLNDIINQTKTTIENLSVLQIKQICFLLEVKLTIYPNGNIRVMKLDSNTDILKDCYMGIYESNKQKYLVCIAFAEIRPTIYKAELMGVVELF